MELTAPIEYFDLNSASALTSLTTSWQSSKTPSSAMLKMFGSSRPNIWACWNGVIRPAGVSMNTRMLSRPRMAYSADEPVSPEVAPRILISSPRRPSSYSKSSPSSCIAMSLNAAVGPSERCAMCRPSFRRVTGTISSSANTGGRYARLAIASRSSAGISSTNSFNTSAASAA